MNTAEQLVNEMTLENLLQDLVNLPDDQSLNAAAIRVSGMSMDSRSLKPGELFIACFGRNHDARDYIPGAVAQGAVAVLAQAGGNWQGVQWFEGVPVIAVENLVRRISAIAGRFHGEPGQRLRIMGVTGTNGKTSCTQFYAQIANAMGHSCGVIGTLGYGLYPDLIDSGYTTPDPIAVQSTLAGFVSQNAGFAAIEASSQGLHQFRLAAVPFRSAVFTNLTRDHLDYHDSMESYGEAKKALFLMDGLETAIINADDPFAPEILNSLPSRLTKLTYSLQNQRADVYCRSLHFLPAGYRAEVSSPWGELMLEGSLLGSFNISNLLAVYSAVMSDPLLQSELMQDPATAARVLSALRPVSGRMEVVGEAAGVTAVVDYAHTPDALRSALAALREHATGSVHCVFGCGGNRDKGKRPMMAEVAEAQADRLYITDDNPRMEDADDIVKQILLGVEEKSCATVERDRARAIDLAIGQARPGDVVLVAGKGHENYQDVAGTRSAFSDVKQVRLALNRRNESVKNGGLA